EARVEARVLEATSTELLERLRHMVPLVLERLVVGCVESPCVRGLEWARVEALGPLRHGWRLGHVDRHPVEVAHVAVGVGLQQLDRRVVDDENGVRELRCAQLTGPRLRRLENRSPQTESEV